VLWYFNVTEAQFFIMIINLICFVNGSDMFLTIVENTGLTLAQVVLVPCFFIGLGSSLSSIYKVFDKKKDDLYNSFSYVIPFVITAVGFTVWAATSYDFYVENHYVFCVTLGFVTCNLVGRIVLARLCIMPFDTFYFLLIPVFIGMILSFLKLNSVMFLYAFCLYSILSYFHFAVSIINELTAFLKIKCFKIVKKEGVEQKKVK